MPQYEYKDVVHGSPDCCWRGDDGLRVAALKLLHSSPFVALRRLQCEVAEAEVVVHGVLPTYYLKQMAQTIILRLDGIRGVKNLIEVRRSDPHPEVLADDAPSYEALDSGALHTAAVR
jgi:hypothetical protein